MKLNILYNVKNVKACPSLVCVCACVYECVCICVCVQSTGETENGCLSQTLTQELLMFVTTVTTGLNVAYDIFSVCVGELRDRLSVCAKIM